MKITRGKITNQRKTYKKKNRSLIIGRFQPFHKGHLDFVKRVLKKTDELIIAIGSSQYSYIFKDPFTAGERITMIHDTLVGEKVDLSKVYIIPISNIENNAIWLAYLQAMVPEFDVVYSGNEFVSTLIRDNIITSKKQKLDLEIRNPIFKMKKEYNGENIRNLIKSGQKWHHLVPPQVAHIIEMIDGANRIKVISRTDSNPLKW